MSLDTDVTKSMDKTMYITATSCSKARKRSKLTHLRDRPSPITKVFVCGPLANHHEIFPPTSVVLMSEGDNAKSSNWSITAKGPMHVHVMPSPSPEESETSRKAEGPGTAEALYLSLWERSRSRPPLPFCTSASAPMQEAGRRPRMQEEKNRETWLMKAPTPPDGPVRANDDVTHAGFLR
ncbi:hypothetical protein BKA81DRAFT_161970 [Phyllosticta paracitricarpa]